MIVYKRKRNYILTAHVEKITDAGEYAEHVPGVTFVPAALGAADFCEVEPSVVALLDGRSIVWNANEEVVVHGLTRVKMARIPRAESRRLPINRPASLELRGRGLARRQRCPRYCSSKNLCTRRITQRFETRIGKGREARCCRGLSRRG